MAKADAGSFELDGLYLAAVLEARRRRGLEGPGADGRDLAAMLAELGLSRAALQSYLDEHREDLGKTLEWIGI